MNYQKINISANAGMTTSEIDEYIDAVQRLYPNLELDSLDIRIFGGQADLSVLFRPVQLKLVRGVSVIPVVGNVVRKRERKRIF